MPLLVPNDEQRAAIDHRGGVLRVLGAPRTGKTETVVAMALERIRRGEMTTDQVLLVASTRQAAALLRRRVMVELGGTATAPVARTAASLAFGVLRQRAALLADPAPRLLNGPEQDIVIRDLLAGHASGEVPAPPWPERVQGALHTRAFRAELRDLLMRAVENSLGGADLVALAEQHDVPEWRAGAHVLEEYDRVTALATPGAYDPAWIVAAAGEALLDDSALAASVRSGLRLVVIDDAHELTPGSARLVATIAEIPSAQPLDIVLVGDPDSTVQSFRGAEPGIVGAGADAAVDWSALSRTGAARTIRLRTAYRPQALIDATRRVVDAIGSAGETAHRDVHPAHDLPAGIVETHLLRTPSAEAAYVASRVREAVLNDGRRWSDIAVIVRGHRRSDAIRRALTRADVPVSAEAAARPVRDEPSVRPLLQLLGAVLLSSTDPEGGLTPELVVDLLGSRIGGTDPVQLRRLRRRLRQSDLEAGSGRPSDVLLVEAIRHPTVLQHIGVEANGARRLSAAYAAGRLAVAGEGGKSGPTVSGRVLVEDVLWAMWSALGLASRWRSAALEGGAAGARADRDLDAVLALFDAASRFSDRLAHADPAAFLAHIDEQEVPGDTLAVRSPRGDSVSVLTPAGAAGQAWPLVIVAGVQDGIWPDLRLRGLLLRSSELVDRVRGLPWSWRSAVTAVRHDETRLFHVAVTRAAEQLIVTAVRDETDTPSPYLSLLDGTPGLHERELTEVSEPTTSRELVAWLRRRLAETAPGQQPDPAVVAGLARLAASGVAGAEPDEWWSRRSTTSTRPLVPRQRPVEVSPSRIQSFHDCPLQWLLTTRGGDGPPVGASALGTLIHDIARDLGDVPAPVLVAEVDARWGRLGLTPGWVTERSRALAHEMVGRLATYYEQAAAEGWTKVGAEVSMRVALGRAVLGGQADRIERDDQGRVRVLDYKTGSSRPRKDDLPRHAQLGAYQVAVQEGGFGDHLAPSGTGTGTPLPGLGESGGLGRVESGGAALVQIGKSVTRGPALDPQAPLQDDPDPRWAHDLVEATAEGMSAASFLARPDEQRCLRCPVRRTCPAQPEGAALA